MGVTRLSTDVGKAVKDLNRAAKTLPTNGSGPIIYVCIVTAGSQPQPQALAAANYPVFFVHKPRLEQLSHAHIQSRAQSVVISFVEVD
eukprot:721918-Amphidinium_carterae.1